MAVLWKEDYKLVVLHIEVVSCSKTCGIKSGIITLDIIGSGQLTQRGITHNLIARNRNLDIDVTAVYLNTRLLFTLGLHLHDIGEHKVTAYLVAAQRQFTEVVTLDELDSLCEVRVNRFVSIEVGQ